MANPVPLTYTSPVQRVGGGRDVFPNASLDLIAAAPEGGWAKLSAASWQTIWLPPDERVLYGGGAVTPISVISAWSSVAWDSKRGRLYLWGGGHANYNGNEFYVWDSRTRLWSVGYHPTEVDTGTSGYRYVRGGSLNAPASAHTYDSQLYLPILDRFCTFGGAEMQSGAHFAYRNTETGLQERVIPCFTAQVELINKGFVGGLPGTNVQRNSTLGQYRYGARAWQARDWYAPGSPVSAPNMGTHTDGSTAYREEAGKDVVYFAGGAGYNLYRIQFNDDDWRNDEVTQVGGYWSSPAGQHTGTIFEPLNAYVRTGSAANAFVYWNLSTPGAKNYGVNVSTAGISGDTTDFAAEIDADRIGIDYDPVRQCIYAWAGTGGRVWKITPPATLGASGWGIELVSDDTAPRPTTRAEALASGDFAGAALGKWRYAPDLDCFVALNSKFNADVWAWKPHGWIDPRGI
jgi:hypothetical protein